MGQQHITPLADHQTEYLRTHLRGFKASIRHSGVLGIGVLSSYRGQVIGMGLLETTLNAAKDRGRTRVELFVRTENERAIRLYEKFGFAIEGVLRKHILIGRAYRDSYIMSILYD